MKCIRMILGLTVMALSSAAAAVGDTTVARWKDDKTAAFLIMFDDGWPSHWQVAIPELAKRGMAATYYVVPKKGEYEKFEKTWIEAAKSELVVLGDHTMTHQGVKDLENGDYEIGECANYIRKLTNKPKPELISFAQPGVPEGKWNLTGEQQSSLLKKYKLIDRPTFRDHGAMYHLKTKEEVLALADKAIEKKGMEYLIWHGVERIEPNWGYQDMWAMKQDVLLGIFDGLKERGDQGKLWITDHISQHKYEVQRDAAEVKILRKVDRGIELELKCSADPDLYDAPLTLITEVPAAWKQVTVMQGEKKTPVTAAAGKVMFDAVPGIVRLIAN